MSLDPPGSYEKGHLMYHTVKEVLICFLSKVFLNKIIRHIHDSKINKKINK